MKEGNKERNIVAYNLRKFKFTQVRFGINKY
jgi:hypothetical protein